MVLAQAALTVFSAILAILILVGLVKIGRWLVMESNRVLPGGKLERYTVMLVGAAFATMFFADPGLTDMELGMVVFVGGLMVILAYRWDTVEDTAGEVYD